MLKTPLVSVCTITYNQQNYIDRCIEGVLSQKTTFPFEFLIGEDCSTDRTKEIIMSYVRQYPNIIKIITSPNNVGPSKNAQRTRSEARGKYIAPCEGDDYWIDPLKLQKQVDFLEENEDYGMVHTDVDFLFEASGKTIQNYNHSKGYKIPEENIFGFLLSPSSTSSAMIIKTPTVLYRSDLLQYLNVKHMIEKKWLLGDLPMWLEISAHSKIKYFDCSTATYRLSDESASRSRDVKKHHLFHLSVYDIRYYYWEKYSKDKGIKRKLDYAYNSMIIGDAFKMNDFSLARSAVQNFNDNSIKMNLKERLKYIILKFRNIINY